MDGQMMTMTTTTKDSKDKDDQNKTTTTMTTRTKVLGADSGIIINPKMCRRLQEMFQQLPLGGRPIYGNCWIYMMTLTLLPF